MFIEKNLARPKLRRSDTKQAAIHAAPMELGSFRIRHYKHASPNGLCFNFVSYLPREIPSALKNCEGFLASCRLSG